MFYTPRFKSSDELLMCAGFKRCVKSTDRGWEMPVERKQKNRAACVVLSREDIEKRGGMVRYHALTHYGFINMHVDELKDGKHIAHAGSELVQRKINEIKELDKPDVYVHGIEYLFDLLSQ